MILAIDFDGVIHDPSDRAPGHRMGRPIDGALVHVTALKEAGHEVVIHTCKAAEPSGASAVEAWLEYFGFPYDYICAIKPVADWYVDDRAVRFTSWPECFVALGVA